MASLGVGHQQKLLLVEAQRFREPANQGKGRAAQTSLDVCDVAGLHPELAGELALREPEDVALTLDEQAQFVLFLHIPYSASSARAQFSEVDHPGEIVELASCGEVRGREAYSEAGAKMFADLAKRLIG